MVNAGLFVEENASRENSKAAVEDVPSSRKFLRFKIYYLLKVMQ